MIARRRFLAATGAALLASSQAGAQARLPLVAVAGGSGYLAQGGCERIVEALAEFGLLEGRDFEVARFFPTEASAELAREIIARRPAVIVTSTDAHGNAVAAATTTIPIVFAVHGDPAGAGLVRNFARPERNVTGIASFSGGATAAVTKLIELVAEVAPGISSVGLFCNPNAAAVPEAERVAAALRLRLVVAAAPPVPAEIEAAFRTLQQERVAGLAVVYSGEIQRVISLAERLRVPTAYSRLAWVEAGGLMSYGTDSRDNYPMAAQPIAWVLRGAAPVDVPVITNDHLRLAINLEAAKRIGLTFPLPVLARADVVIE